MSRIAVVGYELPGMSEGAIEARSCRTWQFVEPLLADGHEVCLVVSSPTTQFDLDHPWGAALSYNRVNLQRRGWPNQIRSLLDHCTPQGILAVTFNSCLRATRFAGGRPVWMDIYGDKVAETQIAEFAQNSSRGRRSFFRFLQIVLRQGDVYSTCGLPQKNALVGQLGMAGRLTRHTVGYEFVYPILPGASGCLKEPGRGLSLRGELVPNDAIIVLWCGGYNVWTEVETLFQGVSQAMSRDRRVVFVSVGGSVRIGQNTAYERFLAKIAVSPYRERFHMLGWRPASEVPDYYRQADVGICLDAFHYETLLGTRTRLVEMMRYGLPVITSCGCELSTIIRDKELGLTFSIGDADALGESIMALASHPFLRHDLACKSQAYASQQLSFAETTKPFLAWAKSPRHAPDRLGKQQRSDRHELEYFLRSTLRGIMWQVWALERGD